MHTCTKSVQLGYWACGMKGFFRLISNNLHIGTSLEVILRIPANLLLIKGIPLYVKNTIIIHHTYLTLTAWFTGKSTESGLLSVLRWILPLLFTQYQMQHSNRRNVNCSLWPKDDWRTVAGLGKHCENEKIFGNRPYVQVNIYVLHVIVVEQFQMKTIYKDNLVLVHHLVCYP